jgi:outer membrane lipoprotein-sorting protein
MTAALRISLLLILLTLFGCASQLQRPQTSQAVAEKMQEEQQPKKNGDTNIHLSPWRIISLL